MAIALDPSYFSKLRQGLSQRRALTGRGYSLDDLAAISQGELAARYAAENDRRREATQREQFEKQLSQQESQYSRSLSQQQEAQRIQQQQFAEQLAQRGSEFGKQTALTQEQLANQSRAGLMQTAVQAPMAYMTAQKLGIIPEGFAGNIGKKIFGWGKDAYGSITGQSPTASVADTGVGSMPEFSSPYGAAEGPADMGLMEALPFANAATEGISLGGSITGANAAALTGAPNTMVIGNSVVSLPSSMGASTAAGAEVGAASAAAPYSAYAFPAFVAAMLGLGISDAVTTPENAPNPFLTDPTTGLSGLARELTPNGAGYNMVEYMRNNPWFKADNLAKTWLDANPGFSPDNWSGAIKAGTIRDWLMNRPEYQQASDYLAGQRGKEGWDLLTKQDIQGPWVDMFGNPGYDWHTWKAGQEYQQQGRYDNTNVLDSIFGD